MVTSKGANTSHERTIMFNSILIEFNNNLYWVALLVRQAIDTNSTGNKYFEDMREKEFMAAYL